MKLYHESNILIREIDFSRCRPYKDFGQGFYLTEIEEQATKMAERTATIYGGKGIVSVFEFDKDKHSLMRNYRFRNLQFRMKNGLSL